MVCSFDIVYLAPVKLTEQKIEKEIRSDQGRCNKLENRACDFFQLINAHKRNHKKRLRGDVGKEAKLPKNAEE